MSGSDFFNRRGIDDGPPTVDDADRIRILRARNERLVNALRVVRYSLHDVSEREVVSRSRSAVRYIDDALRSEPVDGKEKDGPPHEWNDHVHVDGRCVKNRDGGPCTLGLHGTAFSYVEIQRLDLRGNEDDTIRRLNEWVDREPEDLAQRSLFADGVFFGMRWCGAFLDRKSTVRDVSGDTILPWVSVPNAEGWWLRDLDGHGERRWFYVTAFNEVDHGRTGFGIWLDDVCEFIDVERFNRPVPDAHWLGPVTVVDDRGIISPGGR